MVSSFSGLVMNGGVARAAESIEVDAIGTAPTGTDFTGDGYKFNLDYSRM